MGVQVAVGLGNGKVCEMSFVVDPFFFAIFIVSIQVVGAGSNLCWGEFGEWSGDGVPAVAIGSVSCNASLDGGFHSIAMMDELSTIFDDEVIGVGVG